MSRTLPRLTNASRIRSPWRPVILACAVAVACTVCLACFIHWGAPVIARQRWLTMIEDTPIDDLPRLMEDMAQRDESTPMLVELLNHERGDIAVSARRAIGIQMQRWQDMPTAKASLHVAALAKILAERSSDYRAPGRHLAAQLIDRIIHWPLDKTAVSTVHVLADCEVVLQNDPGPESLLDVAPPPDIFSQMTPVSALPVGTPQPSSNPFPKWDVPPMIGESAIEPYSSPDRPGREATNRVDPPNDKSDATQLVEDATPPGEIYAPLAIPLRLAPKLTGDDVAASPIRSNRPAAIADRPNYDPEKLDDVELMRHLHDDARSIQAEEQLRARGFDNIRIEIARRLTHDDPQVRRELADALPSLAGVDSRAWLEELAADRDPSVRRVAISILGTSGDPSVDVLLNQLRHAESNPQVAQLLDDILEKRR